MTPETLAQVISAAEFAERYPDYREAREHAAGIRAMIAENDTIRADKARLVEALEEVRALGIVRRVPDDWDYTGMGGGPTLEQCDEHDLSTIPTC